MKMTRWACSTMSGYCESFPWYWQSYCLYTLLAKQSRYASVITNGQNTALMANKTQTLKIPLEVESNSEKYVVTGFPQYVKIKITDPLPW